MGAAAPVIGAVASGVGAASSVYGIAKSSSDKRSAANAAAMSGRGASTNMMPSGSSASRFNDLFGSAFRSEASKNLAGDVAAGMLGGAMARPSLTGMQPPEATGVFDKQKETAGPTIGPLPLKAPSAELERGVNMLNPPSAANERSVNMLTPPSAALEKKPVPGWTPPKQNTFASPQSKSSLDIGSALGNAQTTVDTVSKVKDMLGGGSDQAMQEGLQRLASNRAASQFAYDPNRKQRLMDLLSGVMR